MREQVSCPVDPVRLDQQPSLASVNPSKKYLELYVKTSTFPFDFLKFVQHVYNINKEKASYLTLGFTQYCLVFVSVSWHIL